MAKNILIYENNPLEPKKFPMEELISLELKEDGATLTYKIAPSKTKRVIIPYSETLVLVPMSRLEYEINKLEGLFWDYPVTEIPYILLPIKAKTFTFLSLSLN